MTPYLRGGHFSDLRSELSNARDVLDNRQAGAIVKFSTFGPHLAVAGGRGGRPAAPATSPVFLSLARACERHFGQGDVLDGVGIPRHEFEQSDFEDN
jgi:hypothetical protein